MGEGTRRYLGHISVNTTHNIRSLNEKLAKAVDEWLKEMTDKGLSAEVG